MAKQKFAMIPVSALTQLDGPRLEVYAAIRRFTGPDAKDDGWVSYEHLCLLTGRSVQQRTTIAKALKWLKDSGWIVQKKKGGSRSGQANLYRTNEFPHQEYWKPLPAEGKEVYKDAGLLTKAPYDLLAECIHNAPCEDTENALTGCIENALPKDIQNAHQYTPTPSNTLKDPSPQKLEGGGGVSLCADCGVDLDFCECD